MIISNGTKRSMQLIMSFFGPHMSIDETCVSNGELYTILSNKDAKGGKGCIAAVVLGTKSEDVEAVLDRIAPDIRRGNDGYGKYNAQNYTS